MEKFETQVKQPGTAVYADTASSGLAYKELLEWRHSYDKAFFVGGSEKKTERYNIVSETKKTVANFFTTHWHNVALTTSFSMGLNMLLEGLPINQNVLLLSEDYPSVNWPFRSRAFSIYYAKINERLEHNITTSIEKNKITVLALSAVQWVNGIRIDMDFLKTLKKQYPELLIIADGTQFCGTTNFNFDTSGIDVLGASAYKWLLSGYGCGFFLIKQTVQKRFSLKTTGFNAANGELQKEHAIPFIKHLEPGHLDAFNFGSLNFSLQFLQKIGMSKIEKHLQQLSIYAKKEFMKLNLLEESVILRTQHSTIFNIKGNEALFSQLNEAKIRCSQRGTGIRFSFHFYNSQNDVDRIIHILKNNS